MHSLLSIIELISVACANHPEKAKGSHAAGPTPASKLGDILDYFKTPSIKSASALHNAAATVSDNAHPGGSAPHPNGETEQGVGNHGNKKKRKRVLDQSKGRGHHHFSFCPSLTILWFGRVVRDTILSNRRQLSYSMLPNRPHWICWIFSSTFQLRSKSSI